MDETSVTVGATHRWDDWSVTPTDVPGDAALPDFDPQVIVDLDLREELRGGVDPMQRIMIAAEQLAAGGMLHLRTPFHPAPLFAVLGRRGFAHHSLSYAEDDWSSYFWRAAAPPEPPAVHPAPTTDESSDALDLRLLPPPEPLMVILERVASDPAPFDVLLPFDPPPLHGFLAAQGWRASVVEVGTDGVRMRVERAE